MSRQQIPAEMSNEGLDALVSFSIENVYYTAGTMLLTQRIIPTRLAASVVFPDGSGTLIVCGIEEAQVRAESWINDIRTYVEFRESPIALLAKILAEKGLASGRIGLELKYLAVTYFRELTELLPKASFLEGDALLERVRVIKSADEIALMRKAATTTDRAIRKAFEAARSGTSEAEMSNGMRDDILRAGADGVAFVVMTTGENSKLVHPTPSDTTIRAGDVVRTDFGGYYGSYFGGYYSDIARTAVAGKPTEKQRTAYQKLFEVHDILLRNVRPGVRACDLFDLCRRSFEDRGLAFHMPHIGHNIGVFIHEAPMLTPFTTDELRPGMVMAIEPIHREDGYIFHVEDEIVVTDNGYELLSPAYDWSKLLTIA